MWSNTTSVVFTSSAGTTVPTTTTLPPISTAPVMNLSATVVVVGELPPAVWISAAAALTLSAVMSPSVAFRATALAGASRVRHCVAGPRGDGSNGTVSVAPRLLGRDSPVWIEYPVTPSFIPNSTALRKTAAGALVNSGVVFFSVVACFVALLWLPGCCGPESDEAIDAEEDDATRQHRRAQAEHDASLLDSLHGWIGRLAAVAVGYLAPTLPASFAMLAVVDASLTEGIASIVSTLVAGVAVGLVAYCCRSASDTDEDDDDETPLMRALRATAAAVNSRDNVIRLSHPPSGHSASGGSAPSAASGANRSAAAPTPTATPGAAHQNRGAGASSQPPPPPPPPPPPAIPPELPLVWRPFIGLEAAPKGEHDFAARGPTFASRWVYFFELALGCIASTLGSAAAVSGDLCLGYGAVVACIGLVGVLYQLALGPYAGTATHWLLAGLFWLVCLGLGSTVIAAAVADPPSPGQPVDGLLQSALDAGGAVEVVGIVVLLLHPVAIASWWWNRVLKGRRQGWRRPIESNGTPGPVVLSVPLLSLQQPYRGAPHYGGEHAPDSVAAVRGAEGGGGSFRQADDAGQPGSAVQPFRPQALLSARLDLSSGYYDHGRRDDHRQSMYDSL